MIRYASIIIRRARKEANLSRRKLIEKIGCEQLSYRTLRRCEEGEETVRKTSIEPLLDYFGIKLVYELQDEAEEHIMMDGLEDEDLSIKECLDEINAQIAKHRTFFHGEEYTLCDYKIKTLMDLIIYLPLIPTDCLFDSLSRICGSCYGREEYVLDQMNYLYEIIPDSKMKKVADRLAERARGCDKGEIPADEDIDEYKSMIEYKMEIENQLDRFYELIKGLNRITEDQLSENSSCTENN